MNEYYNVSLPCYTSDKQITTQMIMDKVGDGFISQILNASLIMLALQVSCLWYIKDWDLPSWRHINKANKEQYKAKLFQTMIYISFVPAMYLPVITIMYKLGAFN